MTEFSDSLAGQGLAVQFIHKTMPTLARMAAAVPFDQRPALMEALLAQLAAAGIVSQAEAAGLTARSRSVRQGAAQAAGPQAGGGLPGFPTVAALIEQSLQPVATESVLDDLFTGICTALGGLVGEALGGPGGAAIGAYLMHQWAEENPPSSW